ncbi:hypothetical protein, partial [Burkholderia pseudomallei]|uniref:hypothetical protein n=1 Tax=Burkholderia pseudomallei TaxID=28450 RepID=UPI001C4CED57
MSFKMVACVMSVAPAGADRTGPGAAAARRGALRCSAAAAVSVSVSVESLIYTVKEALGLTFSRSRHSPDALVRASSRPLTDGAAAAWALDARPSRRLRVASRSPRRPDRSSRFEPHCQPHYPPHRLASDTEASSAEAGGA